VRLQRPRPSGRGASRVAGVGRQPRWRWGMRPVDCPGESRMRENLMSGLGRGSRKRGSPPRLLPTSPTAVFYTRKCMRERHRNEELRSGSSRAECTWLGLRRSGISAWVSDVHREFTARRGRPLPMSWGEWKAASARGVADGAVVGRWSLVVGRWSLVVGRWSLVVGRWSLAVGRWSLVVGRWSLVVGRWSLVGWCWCWSSASAVNGRKRLLECPSRR